MEVSHGNDGGVATGYRVSPTLRRREVGWVKAAAAKRFCRAAAGGDATWRSRRPGHGSIVAVGEKVGKKTVHLPWAVVGRLELFWAAMGEKRLGLAGSLIHRAQQFK